MLTASFILATAICATSWQVPDEFSTYADVTRDAKIDLADVFDGTPTEVKYLNQGWSPSQSMRFYRLPQGSKLIPYKWFTALERASDQTRFADPVNMNRFRYLPLKAHKIYNPDGLPVGFVRELMQPDDTLKTDWLGITCSACHTAEIRFNKVAYRIDGGPAMADHDMFLIELVESLKTTLSDKDKLKRFTKAVLGDGANAAAMTKLASDLQIHYEFRRKYNERNETKVPYGFARLDAFGRIMNETLVRHIGVNDAKQIKSPNAPVSYPFLWGITEHDRVQWNGIARNTKVVVGPLGRNVGEVLGVFGEVDVPPPLIDGVIPVPTIERGFLSSVRFRNLLKLEDTVSELKAPRWQEVFGDLDPTMVAKGKTIFEKHCLECHNAEVKSEINNRFIKTTLTPISDVKTDDLMARNFAERVGKVGNMRGRLTSIPQLNRFGFPIHFFDRDATAASLLVGVVGRAILAADPADFEDHANLSQVLKDLNELKNAGMGKVKRLQEIFRDLDQDSYLAISGPDSKKDLLVYRGRPLEGIWATAPYLHNGSVPNLDELLKPANARVKTFRLGSREYDRDKVGFRSDKGQLFDTSLPGNSNRGHEYGLKDLADPKKKAALMEYLKSL
jgi:hypothetical protein